MNLQDDRSEIIAYNRPGYPVHVCLDAMNHYRQGDGARYPYAAPCHWHNDVELTLVLSGVMKYDVNGEILEMRTGEGIWVNAQQMHYGFTEDDRPCDFICAVFHPIILCAAGDFENEFIAPVTENDAAPYLLLRPDIGWQSEILAETKKLLESSKTKTFPLDSQASCARIWVHLLENLPAQRCRSTSTPADLAIARNMIGFIQKNYREHVTLQSIAAAGAVGQSKCCRIFTKLLGQTPNAYLTRYRLEKSQELLRSGDLPVTHIASAVGFSGSSYFAETFRKYFGMSPSDYRKTSAPVPTASNASRCSPS